MGAWDQTSIASGSISFVYPQSFVQRRKLAAAYSAVIRSGEAKYHPVDSVDTKGAGRHPNRPPCLAQRWKETNYQVVE